MLTEETDPNGNTIAYEYDEAGNITGISVTDQNEEAVGETVYFYDEDGKLSGIENGSGDKIADISYDGNGNVEKEAYGNGSVAEYGYYENGLPSGVVVSAKDSEKQVDVSYEYSVDGQLQKKTDNLSDEQTAYSYDGMGRHESETHEEDGTQTAVEYTYDDASNLLEVSKDGVTELENAYESGNHLETSDGGKAEYDANGNLTRLGDVTYTYDARNRLIQVDMKEHTVCYGYDMNDKLISRNVDGKEEQFVWANDTLVAKLGETNTYYYTDLGENVKASEEEERMTYYLEENSRGDVAALLDEDGSVIEEKSYSAFGSEKDAKESTEFAHGYTGAFYDNVTGLVYLEARFYSPEQGAFLTEDTVTGDRTDAATLNRYIYCTQDPVNKTDRGGHWGTKEHPGMSAQALAANGYTDATMKDCVNRTAAWADNYFHYNASGYTLALSAQSKNRMNLSNLKGYCDQGKVNLTAGKKTNRYGSPYHGRGYYIQYLAYMMGISLQFKKGYQITALTLRNDNEIFQQINFDMLIHLSGLYETKTGKSMTRNTYSYLILGMALHLAEDLWAHVAVVDDSASVLKANKSLFKDVNELITALNNNVPVTYLDLYFFRADSVENKTIHGTLAEGNTTSANARQEVAKQSAARLVQFYKNGRIMYSGNKTLTGASSANATDRSYLMRLQCPKAKYVPYTCVAKGQNRTFYRYTCSACDAKSADSCYLFFYKKTGANNGLGYREIEPGDYR